jgi:transmembrane sensor
MELHKDSVLEDAARWYARLNSPDCTQQERDEFARWQERDAANRQAFSAAKRMAEGLTHAAAVNERLRAMAAEALAMGDSAMGDSDFKPCPAVSDTRTFYPRPLAVRRAWLVPSALAAGIVAASVRFYSN